MKCNIDARGKAMRLIGGSLVLACGLIVAALRLLDVLGAGWWWYVAGVLLAFGAFGIFEARAGWCVVRAMGLKTRL